MAEDTAFQVPAELHSAKEALDVAQDMMAKFLDTANVKAVYGEPIRNGDALVIPAAEVLAVAGFGVGYGYGSGAKEGEEGETSCCGGGASAGGGGGGGGRAFSRPVAVIAVAPDGTVHMEPVVDPTKIVLALVTASGFMMATLLQMLRPRHRH